MKKVICDHYFVSDGAGETCISCGLHKHDARFPKKECCKTLVSPHKRGGGI